jgi:hypothetical protein
MSDESCFICDESNPVVLQRHHIVPRRYAGSDDDENLVTLCANCHVALERIYTDEVFTQLGRAWEDQQPDIGVSDILGILQSSTSPDLSLNGDTEAVHKPFGFGSALAAAYHTVGEECLEQVLIALWGEGRKCVENDNDPAEVIEIQRESSITSRQTDPNLLPEGY